MTVEQYLTMPHEFGWKYEYWDGEVHITPREMAVTASVPVQTREVRGVLPLRAVAPADEAELMTAFTESFEDSVEFCDWPARSFQRSVRESIQGYFAGRKGKPLPASVAAVESAASEGTERIVGAALVVRDSVSPYLHLLFVRPARQRQGVATAMVSAVMNALFAQGETMLGSSYHPANAASVAWHQKFGFVEEPDFMLAQSRYYFAHNELHRREALGDLSAEERETLERECREWEARWKELETLLKREGIEAVSPLHRRHARP
jgi:RimJ/RimL family protein N-acetyltransferase